MRPRIPFDYGFFFSAMVGLMGREPDDMYRFGDDGHYDFRYKLPENPAERKEWYGHAYKLAEWLDAFDIYFNGSRCEIGRPYPPQPRDTEEVLQIMIRHPVPKR